MDELDREGPVSGELEGGRRDPTIEVLDQLRPQLVDQGCQLEMGLDVAQLAKGSRRGHQGAADRAGTGPTRRGDVMAPEREPSRQVDGMQLGSAEYLALDGVEKAERRHGESMP
jgi:hypothetical protein